MVTKWNLKLWVINPQSTKPCLMMQPFNAVLFETNIILLAMDI